MPLTSSFVPEKPVAVAVISSSSRRRFHFAAVKGARSILRACNFGRQRAHSRCEKVRGAELCHETRVHQMQPADTSRATKLPGGTAIDAVVMLLFLLLLQGHKASRHKHSNGSFGWILLDTPNPSET